MRTARRRNFLIAVFVFAVVIVVGLVAERRHAARTSTIEDQANLPAEQPRSGAPPATPAQGDAPAYGVDSTTVPKHVVIARVRPWVDIAGMPAYERASTAERMAIRDLYWRICVEDRIPLEQRSVLYAQFVHKWASHEAGTPESPAPTSSPEPPPEQRARVPSPVDAGTMRRWCESSPAGPSP